MGACCSRSALKLGVTIGRWLMSPPRLWCWLWSQTSPHPAPLDVSRPHKAYVTRTSAWVFSPSLPSHQEATFLFFCCFFPLLPARSGLRWLASPTVQAHVKISWRRGGGGGGGTPRSGCGRCLWCWTRCCFCCCSDTALQRWVHCHRVSPVRNNYYKLHQEQSAPWQETSKF